MRVAALTVLVACTSAAPPAAPPAPANVAPPLAPPPAKPSSMRMGGFPVPPRQGVAQVIHAPGLPPELVSTAQVLFQQGFADPRDCTYREIELATGSVWTGAGEVVATRGWVLPSRDGGTTWAVAWNGLVYPVKSAGAAADVRADLEALLRVERDPALQKVRRRFRGGEAAMVAHDTSTAAKIVLLLQLGEVALATQLWDRGEYAKRIASRRRGDGAAAVDPYLDIAEDWAWHLYDRAINAHMRADHPLALASARMLSTVRHAIESEADRRGFPRGDKNRPRLDFLEHLPGLVADEERRAGLGLRVRLDPKLLAALPPSVRVAKLIEELDEVAARQDGQPGGVDLASDPIVGALIDEGAIAVEPLIAVLESDTRLTRSVHFWRDFSRHRSTLGAHEAAYVAIASILEESFFEAASTGDDLSGRGLAGRRAVADKVRAHWARWKDVPLEERWYRALADDAAKPESWLEAAEKIAQPSNEVRRRGSMVWTYSRTVDAKGPVALRGERLRAHAPPSVFDLLVRRMADPRVDVPGACAFARLLGQWDTRASPPHLTQQLGRAIQASGKTHEYGRCIAGLATQLAEAGALAAIDMYAAWLATTVPSDNADPVVFEPLAAHAKRPLVGIASERLFRAGSPWVPFVGLTKSRTYRGGQLLESNLYVVPAFRAHVVAALSDARVVGTAEMGEGNFHLDYPGGSMSSSTFAKDLPPEGTKQQVRVADFYAWTLVRHHHDTAPPFELVWPLAKRDAALAKVRAWLPR